MHLILAVRTGKDIINFGILVLVCRFSVKKVKQSLCTTKASANEKHLTKEALFDLDIILTIGMIFLPVSNYHTTKKKE